MTDLDLRETKITDRGAEYIARMHKLKGLSLYGTRITDRGFTAIAKLPKLETLDIGETSVAKEVIERVRNERPGLRIHDD